MATQVTIRRKNYPRSIRSFTMLTILVLLLAGGYGYFQYQSLTAAQTALAQSQDTATTLQSSVSTFNQNYTDLKTAFDQSFSSVLNSVQGVYPAEESYTGLTRDLDKFFESNNLFASDLKFSKPKIDAARDYAVLPFTMTITATKDNFDTFLQFVENSGSLEDRTRLLDISSISINFTSEQPSALAGGTASPSQLLNVSVSLNAYFRKPLTSATTAKKTTTTPAS
jgi:hypothetical protein